MEKDKFKGIWLSHSSIGDFLNCPRLYYLRNVYKDPITRHKVTIIAPPLTLGQVVHDTIDAMSTLPVEDRKAYPLMKKFETDWEKVKGKRGGFKNNEEESMYFEKGKAMINRLIEHPGPLHEKAVKIKEELPYFWISEEENLILSGKIDWLIYKPETDSVHILDFKTGKWDEKEDSLQLPIYHLVVLNTQNRKVSGASYWYIDRDESPREMPLQDPAKTTETVLTVGRRIKLARQLEHFTCKDGTGCRHCSPLEAIKNGKGEKVGVSNYNQDLYILEN